MTDTQPIQGSMLLYERPELLSKEDHDHLGLRELPQPFAFARDVRSIPVVINEFRSLQRYCPIVFSEDETPVPLAVLGVVENRNLFVDEDGRWAVPGYIPAYLRCYPLTLANAAEDRYALVFDRAADMVSEQPDVPFFDASGELSPPLQQRLELCQNYFAERQRTASLCARLEELELLVQQQASHTVDGQERTIARYRVVDQDKLLALDADTVKGLFQDGSLAAIIAHLFSLETFSELVRLRQARPAGAD